MFSLEKTSKPKFKRTAKMFVLRHFSAVASCVGGGAWVGCIFPQWRGGGSPKVFHLAICRTSSPPTPRSLSLGESNTLLSYWEQTGHKSGLLSRDISICFSRKVLVKFKIPNRLHEIAMTQLKREKSHSDLVCRLFIPQINNPSHEKTIARIANIE